MIIRKALNDEIYFPLLNDRNQSQAVVPASIVPPGTHVGNPSTKLLHIRRPWLHAEPGDRMGYL